jgi:hypothetical protein
MKLYKNIFDSEFNSNNPFASSKFIQCLEESKALTNNGWQGLYFKEQETFCPGYLKTNSYGEYIFDWQWADVHQQYGINYYPKLIHTTPFTPVNSPKVIGDQKAKILESIDDFFLAQELIYNHHYLFVNEEEKDILKSIGHQSRYSIQFHWHRSWDNFDDFLSDLKSRKRKQIKKERECVKNYALRFEEISLESCSDQRLLEIYNLYLSTIYKKRSQDYLNLNTFLCFKKYLSSQSFVILAFQASELIAFSLFFYSSDVLYGRYWGINGLFEEKYPNLHFEMCYYLGMEYCFKNKIDTFEAGAQGEQKLLRGFVPTKILSTHKFKKNILSDALTDFINEEKKMVDAQIEQYKTYLPFKKSF